MGKMDSVPINRKEPVITEDDYGNSDGEYDSEDDDLSRAIATDGRSKGVRTALKCRSLRIGSYKVLMPTEKVIFVPEGIRIKVPRMGGPRGELATIDIPMRKIVKVLAHFRRSLPVFFIYARPSVGKLVQNVLNMTDPEGLYYNPCSSDESQRRITILPDKLTEDSRILFKELFKTASSATRASESILDELDQKETNEILLRSSPQLPGNANQGSNQTVPKPITKGPKPKSPQTTDVTSMDSSKMQVVHIPGIGQVQVLQPTTTIAASPTKQQQDTQESTVSSSVTSTRKNRKILPKGVPIKNKSDAAPFADTRKYKEEPEEQEVDDILSALTNRYKNKRMQESDEDEEEYSPSRKYKNDVDEDDDEDYIAYSSRKSKNSAYDGPGSYKRLQENKSTRPSRIRQKSRLALEAEEDEEFSIEEDLRIGTRINIGKGLPKPSETKKRKEPIITADMENSDEEYQPTVRSGVKEAKRKDLSSALKCRSLRIGSYKVLMPKDKVIFTPEGITIKAPMISEGNKKGDIVTIDIPSTKIVKILGHFGRFLPVFFVYVKPSVGTTIRNSLNMTDPDGFYFDPCSEDESQKTLTILPDKFLEGSRSVYKEIFKSQDLLDELDQKEANEILFRSSPKENLTNNSTNKSRALEERDNSMGSSKKIKTDQPTRKTNNNKKKKQIIIQQEGGPPIILEVDDEDDADDPDEVDEDKATGATNSPSTSFNASYDDMPDMDEDMNSTQV